MALELQHLSDLTEREYDHYKEFAKGGAFIHCHPFFSIFGRYTLPPEIPGTEDILYRKAYQKTGDMRSEYCHQMGRDKAEKFTLMKYIQIFQLLNEFNFIISLRETRQFAVLVLPGKYEEKHKGDTTEWNYPDEFINWIVQVTQNQPNFVVAESVVFDKGTLSQDTLQQLSGIRKACGFKGWYLSGNYLRYCLNSMIESIPDSESFGEGFLLPEVTIIYNGQYEQICRVKYGNDVLDFSQEMVGWDILHGNDITSMIGDLIRSAKEGFKKLFEAVYAQMGLNERIVRWVGDICIRHTKFDRRVPESRRLSQLGLPVSRLYLELTKPTRGTIQWNASELKELIGEPRPEEENYVKYHVDVGSLLLCIEDEIKRTSEGLFLNDNILEIGLRQGRSRFRHAITYYYSKLIFQDGNWERSEHQEGPDSADDGETTVTSLEESDYGLLAACFMPYAEALGLNIDQASHMAFVNVRDMVEKVAKFESTTQDALYDVFCRTDGLRIFVKRGHHLRL